jgi:hypothetical protein
VQTHALLFGSLSALQINQNALYLCFKVYTIFCNLANIKVKSNKKMDSEHFLTVFKPICVLFKNKQSNKKFI